MAKASNIVTGFNFNGELSKISYENKKIKYIKLITEQDEYWIKIPQKLRNKIAILSPGCQLEVEGKAKKKTKTGKTKYKAQTVVVVAQNNLSSANKQKIKANTKIVSLLPVFDSQIKSKAKVLICNKSNCWKKGGQKVCAEIEFILRDHGLTEEIPIKKTGCLKQCKKAPALVMMPDKARYNKVKPKQVAQMVEKHLIIDD